LFSLLVSVSNPTPSAAEATIEKVQIADGIYQFITSPDGYVPNGNSLVVINENDVLVLTLSAVPPPPARSLPQSVG